MYTWSCAYCPAWAEQYWDDHEAAALAAGGHREQCPAGGHTVVIGNRVRHPEQLGSERRLGNYDPDELLLVPTWAVLIARSAVGRLGLVVRREQRVNFTDPDELMIWARALLAAHPLPDQPPPNTPPTATELAELLKRTSDTLTAALPNP